MRSNSADELFRVAEEHENKKEFELAKNYYVEAEKSGCLKSILHLAFIYMFDLNDDNNAKVYFEKLVSLGYSVGMINLSALYLDDNELDKAEYWLLKAESQCTERLDLIFYNLGCFYADHQGDYDKAEIYYQKAAGLDHASALNNLACLYQDHKMDYDLAETYFLRAWKLDHPLSLRNLGSLYEYHKVDYNKSEFYYTKMLEIKDEITKLQAVTHLLNLYAKMSKHEETFILAHRYQKQLEAALFWAALNGLRHPISDPNKNLIYPILETIQFDPMEEYKGHVLQIMSDVISWRQEMSCRLDYHLTNGPSGWAVADTKQQNSSQDRNQGKKHVKKMKGRKRQNKLR